MSQYGDNGSAPVRGPRVPGDPLVLVDDPAPGVRRVTLDRPAKRNALNHKLRGDEAVRLGWANRAFAAADLDDEVLAVARRIALIPSDITSLNKRTVHRQMDIMGLRAGIRAGTELCALGTKQESFAAFIARIDEVGLKEALSERDEPFHDYRTT